MFPTPRILKDPDGWSRSSFARTWRPAAAEREVDGIQGVLIHGGWSLEGGIHFEDGASRGLGVEGMVIGLAFSRSLNVLKERLRIWKTIVVATNVRIEFTNSQLEKSRISSYAIVEIASTSQPSRYHRLRIPPQRHGGCERWNPTAYAPAGGLADKLFR